MDSKYAAQIMLIIGVALIGALIFFIAIFLR
jgi:hypothetical protein